MRTLSDTLTANQKSRTRPPLAKLVLTKSGQSTQTYDISSTANRILRLSHIEQEWSQRALVPVSSDATLAALSLEGYTGTISYGYNDPTNGDEYSGCAPLEVIGQGTDTFLTGRHGQLVTRFTLAGVFDMMNADHASERYTHRASGPVSAFTVKTLLRGIAGAVIACFDHCKPFTIVFDSEDSLIDTYSPRDYFYIAFDETRLSVFMKLLKTTKCKARIERNTSTGVAEIHIFYPKITGSTWAAATAYARGDYVQPTVVNDLTRECTTAGTSGGTEPTWKTGAGQTNTDGTVTWTARDYDYEFNDAVTYHNFFQKGVRQRLVIPTKWIITSHPSHPSDEQFSGSATDTASETALDRSLPRHRYVRATSDAQCAAIAAALLQHAQVGAERGHGLAPMNCGQEVMDYINITDSVASDSRTGNIGYLRREYIPGRAFQFEFRFGKVAQGLEFAGLGEPDGIPTYDDLNALKDYFDENMMALAQWVLNQQEVIPKLHVPNYLTIPVVN